MEAVYMGRKFAFIFVRNMNELKKMFKLFSKNLIIFCVYLLKPSYDEYYSPATEKYDILLLC